MYSIQSKDGYYFFTKTGKPGRKKFRSIGRGIQFLVKIYTREDMPRKEYLRLFNETLALPLPIVIKSERTEGFKGPVTYKEIEATVLKIDDDSRLQFLYVEDPENPKLVILEEDPKHIRIFYKGNMVGPIESKEEGYSTADTLARQGTITRIQAASLKKQFAECCLPDAIETVIDLRPYAASLN